MPESNPDISKRSGSQWWQSLCTQIPHGVAATVVAVGVLVLIGWQFDIEALSRVVPGFVAMNPLTAVSFIVLGMVLWTLPRQSRVRGGDQWLGVVTSGLCVSVVVVCSLRLVGYLHGWDVGADQILFRGKLQSDPGQPNRMAPNTALNFILLAGSMLAVRFQGRRMQVLSHALALASIVFSAVALIGYLSGVEGFRGVGSFIPMALHTAIAFVAIAVGVLFVGGAAGDPREGVETSRDHSISRVHARLEQRAVMGFTGALTILGIIGIASWRSVEMLLSDHQNDNRVRRSLVLMDELETEMREMHGAARGYLGSGDRESLSPYQESRSKLEGLLSGLREVPSVDPHRRMKAIQLEGLIRDDYRRLGDLIGAHLAARSDVEWTEGERQGMSQALADCRRDVDELDLLEREMLEGESRTEIQSARALVVVFFVGSGVGYLLLVVSGLLIKRDMSARARAEAALQDSEERYRFLANLMPQIVWSTRPDGQVEYLSPQWMEYTGMRLEEARDGGWLSLLHREDRESAMSQWARCLETGEPLEEEYRLRRFSDGAYRWFLCRARPRRDESGACVQWVGTITDIDEQKQLSRELEEGKAAADQANRAKSEFLAHMSHEIRTPLNGVVGMIDLLLGTDPTPQQQRYAELARTSAESLTHLINDILDFSKIEAGKLELDCVEFNVQLVIEDVVEILSLRARGKGLELACFIHPAVPSLVRGDPDRLRQIVVNLLGNAIKFTDQGSVSIVATLEARDDRRATIRFAVVDTGPGIAPERLGRLFKSFSQADASTTRLHGGTGLGLVISQRLASHMGGKMGVESQPGQGSTFWFTVVLEIQAEQAQIAPPRIDARGIRVLAVDDNPAHLEALQRQLVSWGLDVATATNGRDAMERSRRAAARRSGFRVALIDEEMPGMSGIELGSALRGDAELDSIVRIMMLSPESRADSARLSELGFHGQMTKPVRQSQLFDAIMSALARAAGSAAPEARKPARLSGWVNGIEANARRRARILLAEDNEINRLVVMEILKRAGYECEAVGDGKQAVEAVGQGEYDLVLMDCQMPVMDGLDASRAIRAEEAGRGDGKRVAIVALTANAIKGDRERCQEAGMDDYLSKPLNPELLIETMDRHLASRIEDAGGFETVAGQEGPEGSRVSAGYGSSRQSGGSPLDVEETLKRWGQDKEVVRQLISLFQRNAPGDLAKIESSLASGDSGEVCRIAHGLKGAAGYVGAQRIRKLCGQIETLSRESRLRECGELMAQLRDEVRRCMEFDMESVPAMSASSVMDQPGRGV